MGETLREASLNWADYTEPDVTVDDTPMGEMLREASLNWADYAEVTEPGNKLPEPNVVGVSQPY